MVKLYVEGGGDSAALKTACRQGFTQFITNAGVGQRPRVVACGSRRDAYDSYCTAVANGEDAVLLVDSEAPVAHQHQQGQDDQWQPWQHLKQRPGDFWERPESVAKTQVYSALANATQDCKTKAQYGKGEHSFKLLGKIDPAKVTAACPWASRFVSQLKKTMGA